eukprot:5428528-Amphidinium_carterae.2
MVPICWSDIASLCGVLRGVRNPIEKIDEFFETSIVPQTWDQSKRSRTAKFQDSRPSIVGDMLDS